MVGVGRVLTPQDLMMKVERNFSNEPNETYTECNVKDMFSTMIRASV